MIEFLIIAIISGICIWIVDMLLLPAPFDVVVRVVVVLIFLLIILRKIGYGF